MDWFAVSSGIRLCCDETAETFRMGCLFKWHQKRKQKTSHLVYLKTSASKLVFSTCTSFLFAFVSIVSYLPPAGYFHLCCSLGLTLLWYLSYCFRYGSLGNKMQSPVSSGTLCTQSCTACAVWHMTTGVLNFNIKVYARSFQIHFDFSICSRILWHPALLCALQAE